MNPHLTARQISELLAGQRTPAMERHLRGCPECAAEVERILQPLDLFRASVCSMGEQQMGSARFVSPAEKPLHAYRPLRWHMAMAAAAALIVAAIPMVRHFQPSHRTPAVAVAQVTDEALLRQVETEISRSVPATMEPLEKLMSGDDKLISGSDDRRAE